MEESESEKRDGRREKELTCKFLSDPHLLYYITVQSGNDKIWGEILRRDSKN